MKTRFYKILYNDSEIVYIGLTTRPINKRFHEHILKKSLNPKKYSIELIKEIEHMDIKSLDEYYNEYNKVSIIEKSLIKEAKNHGYALLNLTKGGEGWATHLYKKLSKENFFNKYGSLDNYVNYHNKRNKTQRLLRNWITHKSENKTEILLRSWSYSENKTQRLLRNWITHKSENKTKKIFKQWIRKISDNKTKILLKSMIFSYTINKTQRLLRNWITHKSENKTKVLLRSWINVKLRKI